MLILDLGVFHKTPHDVKVKEALTWTAAWIMLAMIFNAGIYYFIGKKEAMEFFAGFILEKSLSIDNIFVFILIFSAFNVPKIYQHRVLFWGVLGAIFMRGIFIGLGVALMQKFSWIMYFFGALLVFTGIKMIIPREEEMDPNNNIVLKLFKKVFPCTPHYHQDHFFVKNQGRIMATPLFLVLLLVETSDLIFAIDSIPAILAITNDTLVLFTSNIFAIMGLRSLYFALGGIMDQFYYLKYALALILTFVGVKMLIINFYHIPIGISLSVIGSLVLIAIIMSYFRKKRILSTSI